MVAFFFYGWHCIRSAIMVAEFERYGLKRLRKLTGSLELLGPTGLLIAYAFPPVLLVASGGLILLMLMGVMTRLRFRNSFVATLPALVLFLMNAFIFSVSFRGECL
ncbi:MAG: hypothetical protein ACI8X5_004008 [Planctomycetota bacterium]|jgi:hypothetical protein